MKKILSGAIISLCLPVLMNGQVTHVGPEAGFASEVMEAGFGLNAIYRVNDQIKLNPKALYFMPHKINTTGGDVTEGTQQFDWWMINLDGDYVVYNRGVTEGFGIMGLNFANIRWDRDEIVLGNPEQEKRQVLKIGLNVGAGVRFNLGDKIAPYAEVRYTLGGKSDWLVTQVSTSQFSIVAGILIRIADDKERGTEDDY